MKKKTILLNGGHGSLINGNPTTAGKRSPVWSDGSILYEGEYNSQIKYRLMEMLFFKGIDYVDICPENTDISRSERIERVNSYDKNTSILIDIHANGFSKPIATGCECFTALNCSAQSTKIAKIIESQFSIAFPNEKWRGVKKKNFDMVALTNCPAVLVESFFMTTERECKQYLLSRQGRDKTAEWLFDSIIRFLNSI